VRPWSRTPREVYAVYGEDEYLAGEDAQSSQPLSGEEGTPSSLERPPLGGGSERSRSGRLIGLGLLVGVTVGAVGLLVVDASQPHLAPGARQAQGTAAAGGSGRAQAPAMARRERTQIFRSGTGANQAFRSGADANLSPAPSPRRSRAERSRPVAYPPNEARRSPGTSQPVTAEPARAAGGEFEFER
jgi:hypothetical protein